MSDKINKDGIAFRLRMLRAEYGLTQAEVADKLEITQQTYSKYESQDIKIDSSIIIKICELYGVSSDYLLGLDAKQKSATSKKLVGYEKSEEEIDVIVEKVISKMKGIK